MAREMSISRGDFLKVVGAGAVAGSTLSVLACQPNTTAQSSGGGGGGPEEKALNFYNWGDYVAKSTIPDFEKQTGIQVTQDFFSSNEDLLAKLQAGGTGYDVIVPSDYMVSIMIKSDILVPLDMSRIPNFKNVGDNYKGLPYDPENEYSVPYQWGTTGILYNKEKLGKLEPSWDPMWDPDNKGKIGMLNDERETPGAAFYKLGYSVNATSKEQLDEAEAELKKQKPLLRGYFDSTQNRPLVINGDLLLGHVFSGDAFLAISSNEDLDYMIPEPAATRWTDNMCHTQGRRAPRQRPQVHKLHTRSQDGGGALQLHLLQHAERGGSTDDRRRPEEPSWLPARTERLRAAADYPGRWEGDSRSTRPSLPR